ncbi:MAG: hypothetical protein V1792_07555 [Pseudomonadota bacterium]
MRVNFIAITTTLALLCIGTGSALAVGYESPDTGDRKQSQTSVHPRTERGMIDALKDASFVRKYPAVIDEVVFTVKDILSQFGIAKNATP